MRFFNICPFYYLTSERTSKKKLRNQSISASCGLWECEKKAMIYRLALPPKLYTYKIAMQKYTFTNYVIKSVALGHHLLSDYADAFLYILA